MKYRTRTFYTETEKALMWERWREGESLHAIAQLFDRNHTTVRGILARAGGIRPRPRTRPGGTRSLGRRSVLRQATDIQVYFCDPQSPWQRGSNENTNRLLRQYFPKGTDLSVHSQARLNYIARELNERPRETLGFKTPKEKFQACVASTT